MDLYPQAGAMRLSVLTVAAATGRAKTARAASSCFKLAPGMETKSCSWRQSRASRGRDRDELFERGKHRNFERREHPMTAQVDKFFDSLHARLDTAESRLKSFTTNIQSLRKQGDQALREGLDQARRKVESQKQQIAKTQASLKSARSRGSVRPKRRSTNGRRRKTIKNSTLAPIAQRRTPPMRSTSLWLPWTRQKRPFWTPLSQCSISPTGEKKMH